VGTAEEPKPASEEERRARVLNAAEEFMNANDDLMRRLAK